MDVLDKIGCIGLVPVVVVENAGDAVKTAEALLAGGVESMEITMRTDAGIEAIQAVKKACPHMLVGAGTVLTVTKATESVEAGAEFIVMPGLNEDIVTWCLERKITVIPGCVTPTEIDRALKHNLNVLKFFPAGEYGGIGTMKALHGPYRSVTFIPTGGVNLDNLSEYASKDFIHALGGSWLCSSADISRGNYEKISRVAGSSIDALLGFEPAHIGINAESEEQAADIAHSFSSAFGFEMINGNGSVFAGPGIEVMKKSGTGAMGHLGVLTNNIKRAVYYLEKRGFDVNWDTAEYKNGRCMSVFLRKEIGGFAIHLLQK